ncbi:MAG: bacteriohemerythrin [Syntrophales bacterium]
MIQWDSTLSVGVAEIDLQHQRLVKMINELNDAMRVGKSREMLGKIVSGLISYVQVHFATEEKYFDQFKYPEADQHKQEHKTFSATVDDFAKKFKNGQLGLSIELMTFLSDWLGKHIKGIDKKYSALFNANGLK